MKTMNDFINDIGIDGNIDNFAAEQKYGVAHVIAYLTEKNQRYGIIISEYYMNGKTQKEIAQMLGISNAAVHQSQHKMLKIARHPMLIKWIKYGIDLNE